jgi:hypothetical protein
VTVIAKTERAPRLEPLPSPSGVLRVRATLPVRRRDAAIGLASLSSIGAAVTAALSGPTF